VGDATLVLRLGPRRDEDIYTKYDRLLLAGACAQIGKALQNCALYAQLQESLANESRAQRTAILTLAKLTEYRDNETGRHLERIQTYAQLLAKQYRFLNLEAGYMSDEYIADLCLSAILHDIGKVGIPDHILLKPGKLNDEEFDIIKQHAMIGGKVLEDAEAINPDRSFLAIGKLVAYHHHEKWDGSGYPFAWQAPIYRCPPASWRSRTFTMRSGRTAPIKRP
jgi:response regulator RpfG family c-di-GMP phosphodiesterase